MQHKGILSKAQLATIVLLGIAITGISLVTWPSLQNSSAQDQSLKQLPKVKSMAPYFKIVSVKGSRQSGFNLLLKNEYGKSITAFDIGFLQDGSLSAMTRELIYNDNAIKPGETWTEWCPYQEEMETEPLTIRAIVFEDGEAVGLKRSIKAIKGGRLGYKMQMERIRPLLERAIESLGTYLGSTLNTLESEISSLPVKEDPSLPEPVKGALHSSKEYFLRRVQAIKRMEGDIHSLRAELTKFKLANDVNSRKLVGATIE